MSLKNLFFKTKLSYKIYLYYNLYIRHKCFLKRSQYSQWGEDLEIQVFFKDTKVGKFIDVVENKNQDLFEVVFNEKRILIPLVDEFVVNIDNENKKIIMNLPEGLTDL